MTKNMQRILTLLPLFLLTLLPLKAQTSIAGLFPLEGEGFQRQVVGSCINAPYGPADACRG